MRWTKRSIVVAVSLWSISAQAETYRLVESDSFLFVELKPAKTLLSKAAHSHVVRATGWTGSVEYDPSAPDRCKVKIDVPVDRLAVDEPKMRKRLKYDKPIKDGDRKRVQESMLDDEQLDGSKFPEISFVSTGCKKLGDKRVEVTGDLQIHGVKKRITVQMEVEIANGRLKTKGQFALTHKDFGFEPYSAALGTIKNDEALSFTVKAIGVAEK